MKVIMTWVQANILKFNDDDESNDSKDMAMSIMKAVATTTK